MIIETTTKTSCYHCSEDCDENIVLFNNKSFCCEGCKLVYELLEENNLCNYYDLDEHAGLTLKNTNRSIERFVFLDDENFKKAFVQFQDSKEVHVSFYLPNMHCSSCVYLLENLHRLEPSIIHSTVNFPKKQVEIIYKVDTIKLSKIAHLLTQIGYEPHLGLDSATNQEKKKQNKSKVIKIGISGFVFGNIMMLSFPEYFSLGNYFSEEYFTKWFSYLNVVLSLPVFFYAASEFFESGWKSLKKGILNIDLPIALAILITFSRSLYEIFSGTGAGYLDSMTGIVFFMLVGRYFQDRTYDTLSFERDYKAFFPLSITKIVRSEEISVPVTSLKEGDLILVRNKEIVPADALLLKGDAFIDYSFVTGESEAVHKAKSELIYAGGRQVGAAITLQVVKEVSQSYLTRLWNKEHVDIQKNEGRSFTEIISKYFTIVLLLLTFSAFLYWINIDVQKAFNVLTTTLIVACPCALLLSATFTNGNIIRHYGRHQFYLKNASVIEKLSKIDTLVFDKTGTITESQKSNLIYTSAELSEIEKTLLKSALNSSSHPLSRRVHQQLDPKASMALQEFNEFEGLGFEAKFENHTLRVGSSKYILRNSAEQNVHKTQVHIEIDSVYKGYFTIENTYRPGFLDMLKDLNKNFKVYILSGDNDTEKSKLDGVFGTSTQTFFNQSPEDKFHKIKQFQNAGNTVMMLGDGLNDSGALMQSDVGLAVTENSNYLSPASDVIMHASVFSNLKKFIQYAHWSKGIIIASFIISLLYNVVGLGFAMQGLLSPVVAAILMPISSISIVLFTTIASSWVAYALLPKNTQN